MAGRGGADDRGFGHAGGANKESEPEGGSWNLLKGLTCVAARPRSAKDASDGLPQKKPIALVSKKPPKGFSVNSPVARFLMYDDAPDPGAPAPNSPAPYLTPRYPNKSLYQIAKEHEGAPEPLAGPPAAVAASTHLNDGWRQENLALFRQNELMCQHIFGEDWDPRYGRSRVRDHQTGDMLCWGDGETYTDLDVPRGTDPNGILDGRELREALRQDQRQLQAGEKPIPDQAKTGRVHLRGLPGGAVAHKVNDGYWRWLDNENVKGIDARELTKKPK